MCKTFCMPTGKWATILLKQVACLLATKVYAPEPLLFPGLQNRRPVISGRVLPYFLAGSIEKYLRNWNHHMGIGTWHTHPSGMPTPSSVDLRDWKKCIKQNRNSTSALVFIIAGTKSYRIWLFNSNLGNLIEGDIS